MTPRHFVFVLFVLLSACASQGPSSSSPLACYADKERQTARSNELQEIVKADQNDRASWQTNTPQEMLSMVEKDVGRRMRVGEIFGEGCFTTAADFAAAALVYQHGDTPDHFMQTYFWAKRAVELGDTSVKRLMAMGIDRFLVNSGHKQLFGSQARRTDPNTCWCIQQTENRFPDNRRKELSGKTLAEALGWLEELNKGRTCPNTQCEEKLKPSPKGTVVGLW